MAIKPLTLSDRIDLPCKRSVNGEIVFYDHLGNVFPDRKALARFHGFSCPGIIIRRMQKGMMLAEALSVPPKPQKHYIRRKKPDRKISALCTSMGLDYHEVMSDMAAGATFEQASDVWEMETPFIFKGRIRKTFKALRKVTGLPFFRLREIFKTAETWEGRTFLIYEAMKGNYHE